MQELPFRHTDRQAVILMGLQASGKSTFYHQMLASENYFHISLDVLRTRNRERMALSECLENGWSFVVDNTNPEKSNRARYITPAKAHSYHIIGIFFQSIVRDCVQRNVERGNKVPSMAIAATSNKLQMPSSDEGFDELYFVRINNNNFEITSWRE